jgi:hypothetical protein
VARFALDAPSTIERFYTSALANGPFKSRYDRALELWTEAFSELISGERPDTFSFVGLRCREAWMSYCEALNPSDLEPSKTKNRVRSALQGAVAGSTRTKLLEALGDTFGALNELVQRVTHEADNVDDRPTAGDARALVFLTLVLMVEIDAAKLAS